MTVSLISRQALHRRKTVPAVSAVAALLVILGCNRSSPQPAVSEPSTTGMSRDAALAEFQAIGESLLEGDNPYVGRRQVGLLRAKIESALPADRIALMIELSGQLLRVGQSEEATRQIGRSLRACERHAIQAHRGNASGASDGLSAACRGDQLCESPQCRMLHISDSRAWSSRRSRSGEGSKRESPGRPRGRARQSARAMAAQHRVYGVVGIPRRSS